MEINNLDEQYNQCLDKLYSYYMNKKNTIKGKLDKDVRKPQIIINIAKKLDLIPDKNHTIKITGSKGKGTTTRLINYLLLKNLKKCKIGMLVSPEEIEHTDRMKINNEEIPKSDFVRIANEILNILDIKYLDNLENDEYFSPSGIFLLIGLKWFKEQGVHHFILELGRGAKYDEVGQIDSKISVVTSLIEEHMSYLGPTMKDLAINKLYVCQNSVYSVFGPSTVLINGQYEIVEDNNIHKINELNLPLTDKPKWYLIDERIAQKAAMLYCNDIIDNFNEEVTNVVSESFGLSEVNNTKIIFEPLVSESSIDNNQIDFIKKHYKNITIIASLPDDKDLKNIISFFQNKQIPVRHITLSGTRGYLNYEQTKLNYAKDIINEIDYRDVIGFKKILNDLCVENDLLYFLGTHTFIRLVKISLKQEKRV